MSDQINHIKNNFEVLKERARIIKNIRDFFWSKNFIEVETPNLVALPGQEPYLSTMSLEIENEKVKKYKAYLHTSPEYTMKKMLAAGFENIFSICKCFRSRESFGGSHNPEFTMLEWYRADADFFNIMTDVEELFRFVGGDDFEFNRVEMRELWQEYVGVDLGEYLEKEKMFLLCKEKGYNPDASESYEDLFYRIFLNEIEPKLQGNYIVYYYPAQMAALSKISEEKPKYAERFEVYINAVEIANAFSELTDGIEQRARLEAEKKLRSKLDKEVYDIDGEFIEAVNNLPKCAGIALGIDRLVQVLLGCKNIDDVLVLPASRLFAKQKE